MFVHVYSLKEATNCIIEALAEAMLKGEAKSKAPAELCATALYKENSAVCLTCSNNCSGD